ncbi:MAG: hypothetical protein ACI4V0_05380, partial [Lachnospiraceae bacterium]
DVRVVSCKYLLNKQTLFINYFILNYYIMLILIVKCPDGCYSPLPNAPFLPPMNLVSNIPAFAYPVEGCRNQISKNYKAAADCGRM